MLAAAQMLFLASLAGAVGWLVYLARHHDAAGVHQAAPAPQRGGAKADRLLHHLRGVFHRP